MRRLNGRMLLMHSLDLPSPCAEYSTSTFLLAPTHMLTSHSLSVASPCRMGVYSSNAAHEALVLVAVYLKFYHNQDHEHMDTPTFNHSKSAFLSAVHTNSAAIQTQSNLPEGSWRDAFDQKNLRIYSDTIPIQNLNKINSILEEIRTIPIPQKLDTLLESGENQAIGAILSTCYFSVLYFSFSQAANPLYRNLVILSPFANNIPLHWFNAEFFGALDFSLDHSNDVDASLREAGISAAIRLLLPWISSDANSVGNSNIVLARLSLKIVAAHTFVCDPSVRLSDEALLAYGQIILKIYGNVSDEVDSKVSTAVVHFARTRLKQLRFRLSPFLPSTTMPNKLFHKQQPISSKNFPRFKSIPRHMPVKNLAVTHNSFDRFCQPSYLPR
ncbi:hypothetical protein BJ741DRAFT_2780 [Chytriomyces cf. hyalinus JEL632]|nr:hypothetical protein BJ741DRAFT_2780 [Chytriomyces cf. hyalinus JEL632]